VYGAVISMVPQLTDISLAGNLRFQFPESLTLVMLKINEVPLWGHNGRQCGFPSSIPP